VQRAWGVWKEKTMYGKKVMGTERTTVVVAPDGSVERVFPKVKVDGHVADVLASL
jgi:peroxiredoxin Q/BCP